ncbi:MAG: hypothetical protein R3D05_21510 [Dongiaceae bacterium]
MSMIGSDSNAGARWLYQRCGYREIAARLMVKEGWQCEGRTWVLLTQEFVGAFRVSGSVDS